MKRATITLTDELETELNAFLKDRQPRPSLTALFQAALRQYLENQKWLEREYRPPLRPLSISVAEQGSGNTDVSIRHDSYLSGNK